MKCQNCGRELKNGARFCIGCGAQHDENGQLVSNNQNNIDYNKTMMSTNQQMPGSGHVDYNKTMMASNTGFKQFQPNDNQYDFQQNNNYVNNQNPSNDYNQVPKKKISPIIIICPIVIIVALAVSFFGGKTKKKVNNIKQESNITQEIKQEVVVATVSIASKSDSANNIHLKGYWSYDADYFYIDGVMQKNMWINNEYYVGEDGKKVVNTWIDNKYYVDATGKKAKNEWIEWTFYGTDGQKKTGFYYVGSDGKRVYDQTIDGRYVDKDGCYWPVFGDNLQNGDKTGSEKIEDKNTNIKENETTIKQTETIKNNAKPKESVAINANKETKIQIETKQPDVINTLPPVAQIETTAQIVPPAEQNITNVNSDGKTIAYQTITQTFPNEKITKYTTILINDTKYQQLSAGINEWNNNRDRTGIMPGDTINSDGFTVTYDLTIGRNDSKVFSLYETKTKFDNNKAYEITKLGYVFDSVTGQLLNAETLFNGEDKIENFAKKIVNKLKSNKSSMDADIYEEIISGEPIDVLEYCSYYMGVAGITILFDRDQVGTNKIDGLSFTLSYGENGDNINNLLLKKYR